MSRSGKAARNALTEYMQSIVRGDRDVLSGQAYLRQIRGRCAGRREKTVSMYELIPLSQRSCHIQSPAKIRLLLDINGIAAG